MFKTVKSKILITTILMLTFLMFAFGCYTVYSRMKTKQLMVQNYGFSINEYTEKIKDGVIYANNNLNGLSLIGALYYRTDRSDELTKRVITRILKITPKIWEAEYGLYPTKLIRTKNMFVSTLIGMIKIKLLLMKTFQVRNMIT